MKKDDTVYLKHILDAIGDIHAFVKGMNRESFLNNKAIRYAVVRSLEIIGEATKRVSKDFRNKNPDIPWADMAGMRDVLIHDYIDVDLEIVWKTASESIPILKALLEKLV